MKKIMVSLLAMLFIFSMAGCDNKNEQPAPELESVTGYIVIDNNTLHLVEVEIITLEDTERITELELTQQEHMPNGYYIYNLGTEKEYVLTEKTAYNFIDSDLLFVENKDGDRKYTTTEKDEFIQYLNTSYSDSPPAQNVPFLIQVKDGKVISITEQFEFTI